MTLDDRQFIDYPLAPNGPDVGPHGDQFRGNYQWCTWMADALRSDPVLAPHVVEHQGWQTWGRPPPQFQFTPRFVLSHHTACGTNTTPAQCVQQVGYVDHGDAPAPIAQLLISRDLAVHVLAAGRANHAGSGKWPDGTEGNGFAIGIEVCNNGVGEPWSDGLIDTYCRVAACLLRYMGMGVDRLDTHHAYTHRKPSNTNVKIDPAGAANFWPQGGTWDLSAWRTKVNTYLAKLPAPQPTPPPGPPNTGGSKMAQVIAKDGKYAVWVTDQVRRSWIDGSQGGSTTAGGSLALAQQLYECGQADGSVFNMTNDEMMQHVKRVGQLEGYGTVTGPDPGDI